MTRLKAGIPYILLLLVCLVLFWPALWNPFLILANTFSPYTDTLVIHWPKAHLLFQSWRMEHTLPLWTPLSLSGMPLAANQLAMLFYPPAWLFLFFPAEPVFNFLFIFHLYLGAVGIFLLLHKIFGLTAPAATFGGITFALNGKWLAHMAGGHVSLVGAVAWMVLTIFGMHGLLKCTAPGHKSSRLQGMGWLLLTTVALAMQIVTHTLPVIYSVYMLGAMVVWHHLINDPRPFSLVISLLRLIIIIGLAALLGAAQLLPLLELVEYSNRSFNLAQASEFALSPAQLFIGLFLPTIEGGHETIIYLGLVPLVLAPLGISRQQRWSWFYAAVLVFTILFALGPYTPVHSLFYYLAPGFRWVRTPARIFLVGAVATAVLAGFAVDRLETIQWSATARRWLARSGTAIAGAALFLGLGLAFGFGHWQKTTFALIIIVPLVVTLVLLRTHGSITTKTTTVFLGLLILLDLVWFDLSMMRFVTPNEALASGQPAARYLAEIPGLFRVYSPSYSLPAETAAAHNLQLTDGVEPVHLAIYDEYMARAGGYQEASFSVTVPNFGTAQLDSALKDVQPNLKLLGMLNVSHLAAAFPMDWAGLILDAEVEGTYIYSNAHGLPRAWVAHRSIARETDWLDQLEQTSNLANLVILESGPFLSSSNRPASAVMVTGYTANEISLETTIAEPGWLVLSEVWYPGWQAEVNGEQQAVERVNGLLRGVFLPEPGVYRVSLQYLPWTVVWGRRLSLITALTVLLGISWVGWGWLSKRGNPFLF